jgi:hypothetical protein
VFDPRPRVWKKEQPLRCANPHHESDPDENPPPCGECGGRQFWFTDPKGIEEPELLCENCTRLARAVGKI